MAKYEITDVSPEAMHRALNPNKGGRPLGALDKIKTGKRNRGRQTEKSLVVQKAAEWHVATNTADLEVTFDRFYEEYSKGMTENQRYFRTALLEKIQEIIDTRG